ncbi:olfactomedin-4-like [Pristis pectinata]|uniref:olfactomedin-4-like n=1 Tax=Pristis pectinata TaxID=685728 RepID=UPI00223DC1DD|nr:olfactomedin-4-like [Pristis pectinata]
MAILLLLLIVAVLEPSAQISIPKAVNGTVNSDGVCVCTVILPDDTFPVEKMEYLEATTTDLSISVQSEISKVQQYAQIISMHTVKLLNLTQRVESIETGSSYTQLDFELLKLEIQELVSLTTQLKVTINGSNTIIEQLYKEIENISLIVHQLESYDKNNVLQIRKEIAALKERLAECEKNQAATNPPPIDYGSCNHGGPLNVTEPFVTQLNWRGFSYKFGGWGRDPSPLPPKEDLYWVAPLANEQRLDTFRLHSSYDDLLLYKNPIEKTLVIPGRYRNYRNTAQGSGMVLYNNSLYYNCYNTRDMCRFNVDTGAVERETLVDAAFNNKFSYQGVKYQDMDFAVDETGLWVIYSTEQNAGNMVISKINTTSFTVERTWVTKQFKPGVTNTFMICGVLYAIRPVSTRMEEIFYTFDTRTGVEGRVAIKMDKVMETIQSVSYNPSDHKLYVYNDGYQVTYDVMFQPDQ